MTEKLNLGYDPVNGEALIGKVFDVGIPTIDDGNTPSGIRLEILGTIGAEYAVGRIAGHQVERAPLAQVLRGQFGSLRLLDIPLSEET